MERITGEKCDARTDCTGDGAKGGIVRRERVTRILYTKRVAKLYTSSIRRTKRGVTTCVLLPTFFSSLLATHTNIIRRNKLLYVLPLVCNSISQVSFEYFFRHFMCVCVYICVCVWKAWVLIIETRASRRRAWFREKRVCKCVRTSVKRKH